jgi:signal transduction histidine kinase
LSATDLISLVVNTAFGLIALATLRDLARHPDRARLDIALLFGSLALAIVGPAVLKVLGVQLPWFSTVTSLLLLAHPYLLLRVVDYFRPLSRRVRWSALAGLAASWLILLVSPGGSRSPLLVIVILYFVLVEGYAAFAFISGARRASGGIRWRMTFAAAGSGWFALLILVVGLALVLPAASVIITPLVQVLILLTVVSYYLGFAPPAALRRAWQLGELNSYLRLLAGRPTAERVRSALDLLCPAVTRAVSAAGSAVYVYQESSGRFVPRAADQPSLASSALGAGGGAVERAFRERRALVAHSPAELGPQLEQTAAQLGAASLFAVPILNPERTWGVLAAFCSRPSLFPGDDQEVLALLADQGAQAIETGELFEQQRDLVVKLEAANKDLEAFSYSVSHDLRAPLRAMDGFSRILLESHGASLDPEAQHYLSRIRLNAKRMGELVDDLLAFSRLGRQPLKLATVEPALIAGQAWEELRTDREGRVVEFQVEEMPPCLADPALLRQVYVNLLSNALKYSRKREQAHITAGCQSRQPDPQYFVRDNGVGFDSAYAHKLFGVFQRLHRPDEYEGTGVGLAIVARIVQRHGGQVSADSKLDEGATFYFTLKGAATHVASDDGNLAGGG